MSRPFFKIKMPDRCDVLAAKNPHPRDARVEYIDETHTYLLDGVALPLSVSGLWSRYFPHFDANECLNKYFKGWVHDPKSKYFTLLRYLSLVHKMDDDCQQQEIKKLWSANGADASDLGTQMHHDIEFFLNDLPPDAPDAPEFLQFRKWWDEFMPDTGIAAYRTEFSIYDEDAKLAGQIDCLLKTTDGRYVMVDWKRVNPTPRRPNQPPELLGPDQRAFNNECGVAGMACEKLPNTSFWHYVVQQRLYANILSKHYDIEVDSSWLLQMHPALGNDAHAVEVPRIDAVIDQIMSDRYLEVEAGVAVKRAKIEDVVATTE